MKFEEKYSEGAIKVFGSKVIRQRSRVTDALPRE